MIGENRLTTNDLAIIFSDLAWRKIFIRDFAGALQASLKAEHYAADINSSSSSMVVKNLALSYLLSKNYNEAEKLIINNKNKTFNVYMFDDIIYYNYYKKLNSKRPLFQDVFLTDLDLLKHEGIITKGDPEVKKITAMLH